MNVFRAGKFKSYTDQFSRSDMSEHGSARRASRWLNALWAQYQAGVVKARGLDAGAIAAYANDFAALRQARSAAISPRWRSSGLVTELKSRREVEEQIKALVGEDEDEHTFQGIAHWDYLAAVRAGAARCTSTAIASASSWHPARFSTASSRRAPSARIPRRVCCARRVYDDDIKAVVLRIDSPGGSMLASEVIRREIDALREAGKPVVASMSSTAASGGYYIAMDADEIWASPATLTGSIGVFAVFPTFEHTLDKIGVTIDGVGTTPLAGSLQLDRTLSDEAKQILQSSVEHAYSTFIGHVAPRRARSRSTKSTRWRRVACGPASMRLKHGLVDNLGSYQDALNAAAKRAKLGDDYKVEYIEPALGWREALAHAVAGAGRARYARAWCRSSDVDAARAACSRRSKRSSRGLSRFTDPMQVYYYCRVLR